MVEELKRMSIGCQEEFFICQYPHPFRDDLCFFDDFDDRRSFEELYTNTMYILDPIKSTYDDIFDGRVGPYSNFRVASFF